MQSTLTNPYSELPGERFFRSKWIWPYSLVRANTHVLFRSSFEISDTETPSWLFIAVESFARVFLNGEEILRTSSISYPGQHYCESVELTGCAKEGTNELVVLAWYIGIPSGSSCPKDPGLLAEVVDGNGVVLSSSCSDWMACPLEAWQNQHRRSKWLNLDLIEILDFGKLPIGFPMIQEQEEFVSPEETGYPGARFVMVEPRRFSKPAGDSLQDFKIVDQGLVDDLSMLHEIPSMAVLSEEIEPESLAIEDWNNFKIPECPEGKAWTILIDLGTYEKGLPELTANGDRGTTIDISWYETLEVARDKDILSKVYATDRYILSGGSDKIAPEEWKCGRFLQLTFRKIQTGLKVRNFTWRRLHYPLQQLTNITSSSSRLKNIIDISLHAAALCMHDNIMDCPWRERRQWIGDVQRIALINYYAFGEYSLPRAVLKQHARLQDTSGRIWVCLPVNEEFPSQSMEWLRAILEYQQYSRDETLLQELGHNIELLHRWFLSCRDERGLFFLGTRPAINWMDNSYGSTLSGDESLRKYQFKTPFLSLNLRYLLFLDDISASMEQLGKNALAEQAAEERKRLSEIIREHFWDPEIQLFRDCADAEIPTTISEMGHALAVRCQLPGLQPDTLWDRFIHYSETRNDTIPATPFGKHHTHEALGLLGRPEDIVKDILKHWGPMVDADADTAWESFDGEGSRCHGWAGIPVVALLRHVLKLEPSMTGDRSQENLAGIEWILATRLG